jgi:hypothetical protein
MMWGLEDDGVDGRVMKKGRERKCELRGDPSAHIARLSSLPADLMGAWTACSRAIIRPPPVAWNVMNWGKRKPSNQFRARASVLVLG